MPAGKVMQLVYRRPHRNVDLFAAVVHCHPGNRHPMLHTDQSANPQSTNFDALQTGGISHPHTNAFTVGGEPIYDGDYRAFRQA